MVRPCDEDGEELLPRHDLCVENLNLSTLIEHVSVEILRPQKTRPQDDSVLLPKHFCWQPAFGQGKFSLGVGKVARQRRLVLREWQKARAALHLRWKSPSLTAEGSWHQGFLSDSGRETPGTSSKLLVKSRPSFRWAFRCKNRLSRAPAGFQRCDRELALAGRAPCVCPF